MNQITAAAAAGDEALVARLSKQAILEDTDRRRQATPLPAVDRDEMTHRIEAEEDTR